MLRFCILMEEALIIIINLRLFIFKLINFYTRKQSSKKKKKKLEMPAKWDALKTIMT